MLAQACSKGGGVLRGLRARYHLSQLVTGLVIPYPLGSGYRPEATTKKEERVKLNEAVELNEAAECIEKTEL